MMFSFEQLPIELIHEIFHYLHPYDIIFAFLNLNYSFNRIIESYDQYELNFQSISRRKFDFILQHIHPKQVISLILSNLNDTTGQFQLFLSKYSLKQFSRLQTLQLIQPSNPTDFNEILIDLHTLSSLRSLSILHCSPMSVNHQTFHLFSSFLNFTTSLQRLSLSGTLNNLFEHSFHSSIKYLYFNDNLFNTIPLSIINNRMPLLKSLDTAITLKLSSMYSSSFTNINRLILTIFIEMKNIDLKNLLNPLLTLTFLKIIANGKQWFNGHFWEECLPINLKIFQFNFCTSSIHIDEKLIFETFQTSFWIHRKHWYVMLDYQMHPTMIHLYSLPFCDTQFYYRPTMDINRKFLSTIPLKNSYLDHVKSLTIDLSTLITETNVTIISPHFFSNISTLILADNTCHLSVEPLFYFLKSIVNLQEIVQLKLGQFHHSDLIEILYKHLPKLTILRIPETIFIKLQTIDFSNITSLTISDCLTDVKRMYSMFPNVKNLCVKLINIEQMQEVLKFYGEYLNNLTFRHVNQDIRIEFVKYLHEYYNQSRQFSYNVDEHMNIHIWLENLLF